MPPLPPCSYSPVTVESLSMVEYAIASHVAL